MLTPTHGTITVLGGAPRPGLAQLARVGFVAQDTAVVAGDGRRPSPPRRLGAPGRDDELARQRIGQLALDPEQRAGSLSGGQRAQLALTLAMAKRPELLILDEPVASLDPLARREFLQGLMEVVAEQRLSVVLSSHLVADLERVCDYLVVLVASLVRVAGEVSDLLASHHRLSGPRRDPGTLPAGQVVITESHTDKQSSLLVRTDGPVLDPAWAVKPVSMEDLVLAYMSRAGNERWPVVSTWEWCRDPVHALQFRIQAITAAVTLVAFAVLLAATGPHLASTYAADGLDSCHGSSCLSPATYFTASLAAALRRGFPAQHRDRPAGARRHRPVLGSAR